MMIFMLLDEAKLCIFGEKGEFRSKDALFVHPIFFHFLWSFQQIFNMFKNISL